MVLTENAVGGLVTVLAGALGVGLGYLIRIREQTWLVAGHRSGSVEDEAGLAAIVGGYAVLVGVVTAGLGAAMALVRLPAATWDTVWLGYVGALVASLVIVTVVVERRFGADEA